MPAIYWTMATLAIENTISSTPGVRLDEYTQSVHGPSPANTTSRNRELSPGPMSRGLSLILFTPERTWKHTSANRNPFASGYSIAVLVLCASGSFGIVRFEKQTDGTRRARRRSRCREWFKRTDKM